MVVIKPILAFLLLCLLHPLLAEEKNKTAPHAPAQAIISTEEAKRVVIAPVVNNIVPYNYDVVDKTHNVTCILARFAAEIQIQRFNPMSNTSSTVNWPLTNESRVDPASKCEKLVIDVDKENGKENFTLTLNFKQANGSYYVESITLVLNNKTSSNVTENISAEKHGPLFRVPNEYSYSCAKEEKMELKPSHNESHYRVDLFIQQVHIDAFRNTTSTGFRAEKECSNDADDKSGLIPIIVGVALAALVVIVLIGYFIGRSRSRRLAYQSV